MAFFNLLVVEDHAKNVSGTTKYQDVIIAQHFSEKMSIKKIFPNQYLP